MSQRISVVQRVKDYIEAHFAEGISLSDVAKALNYSPSHLTCVIRRATGRPVTAWIIERRLVAARERLLTTDDSVAIVGESVGFRNAAYFARRFARANGTTPGRWRKRFVVHRESVDTCPTCGAQRFLEAG